MTRACLARFFLAALVAGPSVARAAEPPALDRGPSPWATTPEPPPIGSPAAGPMTASDSAEPPQRTVWDRHLSMYAHIGVSIPHGFLGLSVVYTPTPLLSLELTGGAILVDDIELANAALLAQFKPLRGDNWAFTVGAGPSLGVYDYGTGNSDNERGGCVRNDRTVWANVELGAEGRFESGFSMRFAAGVSKLLNPHGGSCSPPPGAANCDGFILTAFPNFTFSMGFAAA